MKFNDWLSEQAHRQDSIGQLADFLLRDSMSPLWSTNFSDYTLFFTQYSTTNMSMEPFFDAISEWQKITDSSI